MMNEDELAAWKSQVDTEGTSESYTYLMIACMQTNLDVVVTILNECVDTNVINKFSDTALTMAISFCRYDDETKPISLQIVRLLLDHGADINLSGRGLTPLDLAVVYRLVDILKLLIDRGADVNLPNSDAYTPLQLAIRTRAGKRIITMLEKAGATGATGGSVSSSGKPIWGAKTPKIAREDQYEEMAATWQCLEIGRLNETLKKHGITDVTLRRAICKEYIFDNGCFMDSGWFESENHVVWPELCFAERLSNGDGPIQTLHVMSAHFSYHEYAGGDIDWYFDEHGESVGEIVHGAV